LDDAFKSAHDALWATVADTERLYVSDASGTVAYTNAAKPLFMGTSTRGPIRNLSAGFDLNLATGSITDGFINICASAGSDCSTEGTEFEIEFSGLLYQQSVDVAALLGGEGSSGSHA